MQCLSSFTCAVAGPWLMSWLPAVCKHGCRNAAVRRSTVLLGISAARTCQGGDGGCGAVGRDGEDRELCVSRHAAGQLVARLHHAALQNTSSSGQEAGQRGCNVSMNHAEVTLRNPPASRFQAAWITAVLEPLRPSTVICRLASSIITLTCRCRLRAWRERTVASPLLPFLNNRRPNSPRLLCHSHAGADCAHGGERRRRRPLRGELAGQRVAVQAQQRERRPVAGGRPVRRQRAAQAVVVQVHSPAGVARVTMSACDLRRCGAVVTTSANDLSV